MIIPVFSGCAAPEPGKVDGTVKARAAVEAFIDQFIAQDFEKTFHYLDMDSLVNYGRPQGEICRCLDPSHQRRFRKDFIEGFYFFSGKPLRGRKNTRLWSRTTG